MKKILLIIIIVAAVLCVVSNSHQKLHKISMIQTRHALASAKKDVSGTIFNAGKSMSSDMNRLSDNVAIILTQKNVVIFFLGAATLLLIAWLSDTKFFSFLATLEHELMHGVAAVLCGGKFNSMTVTASKGGRAEVTSNFFVRLAPYSLPMFCVISCCLLPILNFQAKNIGILMAGMAYGNYLRGNFPNISIQPDISESCCTVFAYTFIFISNSIFISVLFVFLARI